MFRTFIALLAFSLMPLGTHAQDQKELRQTHEITQKSTQKTTAARYLGLDMVELVGGTGEKTDHGRLALHWKVGDYRIFKNPMKLSLAGSYALYNLSSTDANGGHKLRDVGLTPTALFHFRNHFWGMRPFLEMGVGFHYLTQKKVSEKNFSTNFQFGDHISVGFEFGKRRDYRINYQFQHLSNGGIESPNPGINFHLISFGARLH